MSKSIIDFGIEISVIVNQDKDEKTDKQCLNEVIDYLKDEELYTEEEDYPFAVDIPKLNIALNCQNPNGTEELSSEDAMRRFALSSIYYNDVSRLKQEWFNGINASLIRQGHGGIAAYTDILADVHPPSVKYSGKKSCR